MLKPEFLLLMFCDLSSTLGLYLVFNVAKITHFCVMYSAYLLVNLCGWTNISPTGQMSAIVERSQVALNGIFALRRAQSAPNCIDQTNLGLLRGCFKRNCGIRVKNHLVTTNVLIL